MKTKIKIIAGLFLFTISLPGGCVRQELDVVSRKPEFNEQSKEYQQYLFERAVAYIKAYRFVKVSEIKEQIMDEGLKSMIDSVYQVYHLRAYTEALYYARPNGDTLFFVVPNDLQPDRLTRRSIWISPEMGDAYPEPLSRGIMAGFKNYPALVRLTANTFADEYRELDQLPLLETLLLGIGDAGLFEAMNPGEKAPVMLPVTADLSANHNLKKITLTDINIDHFTFPDHTIENLTLSGANADSPAIGGLKANVLIANPLNVEHGELIIDNPYIDSLFLWKQLKTNPPLKIVDISRTRLKIFLMDGVVSELVLNDNLESLRFSTKNMETPPQLPVSLRELTASWYHPAPDFSRLTNLEILSLRGEPFPHGVTWPPNIVQLEVLNVSGTIDLSGLGRLRRIIIHQAFDQLDEIIFPPNLVESELNDPASFFYSGIYISRSCKLTGKPDWLDSYIHYTIE